MTEPVNGLTGLLRVVGTRLVEAAVIGGISFYITVKSLQADLSNLKTSVGGKLEHCEREINEVKNKYEKLHEKFYEHMIDENKR